MEEALRHMESLGELFNKNDEWFTSNYNSDCWYIKNLGKKTPSVFPQTV